MLSSGFECSFVGPALHAELPAMLAALRGLYFAPTRAQDVEHSVEEDASMAVAANLIVHWELVAAEDLYLVAVVVEDLGFAAVAVGLYFVAAGKDPYFVAGKGLYFVAAVVVEDLYFGAAVGLYFAVVVVGFPAAVAAEDLETALGLYAVLVPTAAAVHFAGV